MNADAIAVKVSSDNLEDQIAFVLHRGWIHSYPAGYLNAGIDTRAPASSALDKATWTDARGKPDRQTQRVFWYCHTHTDNANSFNSHRVCPHHGDAMTPNHVGNALTFAAASGTRLTSDIHPAGSIGKLILDNLNATISRSGTCSHPH